MIDLFFTTLNRALYRLSVSPETTIQEVKDNLVTRIFGPNKSGYINKILWNDYALGDDKKIGDFPFILAGKIDADNRLTVHCGLLAQDEASELIDTTNQFRVWYSDNPEQYLPPQYRIILHESIKRSPNNVTTLVTDSSDLSAKAKKELAIWSSYSNCNLVELSEITPNDDYEAIILQIVKAELHYWKNPPYTGSCGIASDFTRLLLIDRGVYLDCDIFVLGLIPQTVKMPFGCFLGKFGKLIFPFNNDVMCFNSSRGREILHEIRKELIVNYLQTKNIESISPDDINRIAQNHMKNREIERNKSDEKTYAAYFNNLVLTMAGPTAIRKIITRLVGSNGYDPSFSEWICEEFSNYLVRDAHLIQKNRKRPEWLPNSTINHDNENAEKLMALRKELQALYRSPSASSSLVKPPKYSELTTLKHGIFESPQIAGSQERNDFSEPVLLDID